MLNQCQLWSDMLNHCYLWSSMVSLMFKFYNINITSNDHFIKWLIYANQHISRTPYIQKYLDIRRSMYINHFIKWLCWLGLWIVFFLEGFNHVKTLVY